MRDEESFLLAALAKHLAALRKSFDTLSKQPGPSGADGKDGCDGVDGKAGRDGMHGADGTDGRDGRDGADGKDGRDGVDGKDGEQGPAGPMPAHRWAGTKLQFEKPDGTWGKKVDLRGPAGPAGKGGGTKVVGVIDDGGDWNPDQLPVADWTLPQEFVVKQEGEWRRASLDQMRLWMSVEPVVPPSVVTVGEEPISVNGAYVTVTE